MSLRQGEEERKGCYAPVLQALEAATQHLTDAQKAEYNVLVPGAGLARLVWEVVRRGYSCQGALPPRLRVTSLTEANGHRQRMLALHALHVQPDP